jgi:hypothetical protein
MTRRSFSQRSRLTNPARSSRSIRPVIPGTTVMVRLAISRMGSGLPFAPQDAQDVVLRGGSQPISPQQPGEAYLKLIAGRTMFKDGFLFGDSKGRFFLSSCCNFGVVMGQSGRFVHLHIVYMSSIGKSSPSLAVFQA